MKNLGKQIQVVTKSCIHDFYCFECFIFLCRSSSLCIMYLFKKKSGSVIQSKFRININLKTAL